MKLLLLLINFQFFIVLGYSQTFTENYQPQTYADSIALAKSMIDNLDFSYLESLRENYRSQNIYQAQNITDDVMALINERYAVLQSRVLFNLDLVIPENMTLSSYSDSLQLAKSYIDELSFSQFPKILERYRYLNFKYPEKVTRDVLIYLEEKFKTLNHEN